MFLRDFFVLYRFTRNSILFRCPFAEVNKLASFRTKGPPGVFVPGG